MKRYLRIWWLLATNSFHTQVSNSLASAGYLLGKLIRFVFFLIYILAIFRHIPGLAGYTLPQVVLFFLTFNIVDVGAQFLFRGLYSVKVLIEEGDFDKILTQPVNPLFRISSMGVDLMDLLTLLPMLGMTIWTFRQVHDSITPLSLVLYFLLLANALLIAYAFHIFVGALSVRTQEFEGAIWIYRDLMSLGRFPVAVYADFLRAILVSVIPIGVMISYPSQALLGLLSFRGVAWAALVGSAFYLSAHRFWKNSLKNYISPSS